MASWPGNAPGPERPTFKRVRSIRIPCCLTNTFFQDIQAGSSRCHGTGHDRPPAGGSKPTGDFEFSIHHPCRLGKPDCHGRFWRCRPASDGWGRGSQWPRHGAGTGRPSAAACRRLWTVRSDRPLALKTLRSRAIIIIGPPPQRRELKPALTIAQAECDEVLERLRKAMSEVLRT